ncbi:hypothetical protein BJX64DRAFT_249536 [Aspergillus heterothallicus]
MIERLARNLQIQQKNGDICMLSRRFKQLRTWGRKKSANLHYEARYQAPSLISCRLVCHITLIGRCLSCLCASPSSQPEARLPSNPMFLF